MTIHIAKPEHEVTYQELVALVTKHSATMKPAEILAIAANMVGKLVAMQDQRTITPEIAMEIVSKNIELGNSQAFARLDNTVGTA